MKQQNFKRSRYFHFTTKLVHPKFYDQTQTENWLNLLDVLQSVQNQQSVTWHSGVLMSNHVHLLMSIEGYYEHSLILELEKEWKDLIKIKKPLFQRPLPCEPIDNFEHFKLAYKYIYRNPVEAGLSPRVEIYPFSSLPLILNFNKTPQKNPFVDPMEIIFDPYRRLRWLNSPDRDPQMSFAWFDI
jgi:putative transposase